VVQRDHSYFRYISGNFSPQQGTRIVIPHSLQNDILNRVHDGHQGIVKCRERARASVWWIGLSSQLEAVVKNCQKCIENTNDHASNDLLLTGNSF
jgi:hypothetical protein